MTLLRCEGLIRRPWIEGDGFDLVLEAGEAVCLRAPSGTGKTLLLRGIADLDPIDAGALSLDGEPRDGLRARDWRRAVRYVPQTPPRRPGTVADAVREVTELLGCEASAPDDLPPDRELSRLSGGEAQRFVLSLALTGSPRVLLLDEPTASLDDARAGEVFAQLRGFLAGGGAILAVSHDDDFAARLGATVRSFP